MFRIRYSDEARNYLLTAFSLIAVAFMARAHGFWLSSIDWDEGVYLVMAQRWLGGGLPYVEVWDQHPPGLPALLMVVQAIIRDPVFGARLSATMAVFTTGLVIHRFCVDYLKHTGAGLIGALLYIMCISRWHGLAANTEVFNNLCVTSAAFLLYGAAKSSPIRLTEAVVAATILGVGLQIKYVILPEASLLCLGYLYAFYLHNRSLTTTVFAAVVLLFAGCLPTGIAILYFWFHNALGPFIHANVESNLAYLEVGPPFSAIARSSASGIAPLTGPIIVIGYAVARYVQGRRTSNVSLSAGSWILLWTVGAIADVCLPLKFFTHYYFALYPPLCLSGALAVIMVAENRKVFASGLIALFVAAVPLWVAGTVRASRGGFVDVPRKIAELVRRNSVDEVHLFVYDYQPVIYALARVHPPTPYIFTAELARFSYSAQIDGVAELRRIMASFPDFVVLRVRVPGERLSLALDDKLDDIMAESLVEYHLIRGYTDGENFTNISVYKRNL